MDFSRLKADYPNMWSKNYRLLPLPKPYQETKQKFTEYCQNLNTQIEALINSWQAYFQQAILPLLESPQGDQELLFRTKRLLNNKIVGESTLLFLDLVIWEIEYRQQQNFKAFLPQLNDWVFNKANIQSQWETDLERMTGRINYQVANRFWWKWGNKIGLPEAREEVNSYLKLWQKGKAAKSEWKEQLEGFKKSRDNLFNLGSQSINDGQPCFQLGFIKEDTESGLRVACQNRKGFNLNNPFLFIVHFHQKLIRVYTLTGYEMIDPRRLYVSLHLQEDWIWKDYPWVMNSCGSLRSGDHPIYWGRNL
ncbi:MAG: hypothetical protein MRERV_38c025 [Mycoplasmataceae bacterium RV_VA103A]|nr:MAG: hypothetical protein MRERV_38c025 [Mycoplasmataceae bacterium RV_VA103A]